MSYKEFRRSFQINNLAVLIETTWNMPLIWISDELWPICSPVPIACRFTMWGSSWNLSADQLCLMNAAINFQWNRIVTICDSSISRRSMHALVTSLEVPNWWYDWHSAYTVSLTALLIWRFNGNIHRQIDRAILLRLQLNSRISHGKSN